ncbi:MAG: hypothetical protein EAZ74_02830 [Alphaproteobacteria bacterium]|nr:MAG: hypothetical protein EAY76_02615 [Alphaproteobacteria bacterium]TAF14909.1 MAG: hypothetical protein EAZ74_02830 [Alphaproteobacteria bacterium]TAF38782.1 MAG: hypothetical protein EAZ66_05800 [Alphaproteobacteria bacterium]TAF77187.1 MAG: hypothetical protein EAZ52_01240 [Alphaproteobacteria bacterium]
MKYTMIVAVLLLLLMGISSAPRAQEQQIFPRAMSLRANKVQMRVGPGKMFPILWTYTVRGIPMMALREHMGWMLVRDPEGAEGWVYARLLSSVRTAMITHHHVLMHHHPDHDASVVAKLMQMVVVIPISCQREWCLVRAPHKGESFEGWVHKPYIWGIGADEVFELKE